MRTNRTLSLSLSLSLFLSLSLSLRKCECRYPPDPSQISYNFAFSCYPGPVPSENLILRLIIIIFILNRPVSLSWSSGLRRLTRDAKVEGSNPDTALILWQDINLHLLLSTKVSNGYPVGCGHHWWSNSL